MFSIDAIQGENKLIENSEHKCNKTLTTIYSNNIQIKKNNKLIRDAKSKFGHK